MTNHEDRLKHVHLPSSDGDFLCKEVALRRIVLNVEVDDELATLRVSGISCPSRPALSADLILHNVI